MKLEGNFGRMSPKSLYFILNIAMDFVVQAPSPNTDLPFPTAMFAFTRAIGQTVGVATCGVIFQNAFAREAAGSGGVYPGFAGEWSKSAMALIWVLNALGPEKSSIRVQ